MNNSKAFGRTFFNTLNKNYLNFTQTNINSNFKKGLFLNNFFHQTMFRFLALTSFQNKFSLYLSTSTGKLGQDGETDILISNSSSKNAILQLFRSFSNISIINIAKFFSGMIF